MGEVRHVLPSGGRGSCGTSSKRKGEVAGEGWRGGGVGGGYHWGGGGRRTRNRDHIHIYIYIYTYNQVVVRSLAASDSPRVYAVSHCSPSLRIIQL